MHDKSLTSINQAFLYIRKYDASAAYCGYAGMVRQHETTDAMC